jgi:hypothetical protein
MNSLSQAEISRKYNVSRATVNRWIKLSQEGIYNLELDYSDDTVRVYNSKNNSATLENLAKKGKVYKPNTSLKRVDASDNFYNIFSLNEQIEIFTDLLNKNSLNLKYWYKNVGATQWNNFYKGSFKEIGENTEQLLEDDIINIISKLQGAINIIDVGAGNGYPAKRLIKHLSKHCEIKKYVGIDLSEELSYICEQNLKNWFPDLNSSFNIIDIEEVEHKKIASFLLENKYLNNASNIILYLGNTLSNQPNFNQVLANFRSGMMKDDLLVFTVAMDTLANRSSLNYIKSEVTQPWILQTLGIDVELCQTVVWYDDLTNCKYKASVMDKDYEIKFKLFDTDLYINYLQGDRIVRWRDYLFTISEISKVLDSAELAITNISIDKNGANALIICNIKK